MDNSIYLSFSDKYIVFSSITAKQIKNFPMTDFQPKNHSSSIKTI